MTKPDIGLERRKLRAMAIMLITVFLGIMAYLYQSFVAGDTKGGLFGGIIAITVFAFMIPLLRSGYANVTRGMPMKDERTRRIETKAAALAFYVSIYVLLAIGMFGNDLEVHTATGLAIFVSAVVFGLGYIYYGRSTAV